MILDYNATKDGVDNMDEMFASCTCQHLTVSWLLTVFYNITDVSASNIYLLWIHGVMNASLVVGRRRYLEKLGKALVTPQILLRKRLPRPLTSAYFVQTVQNEEQRTSQSIVETKCIPDKILCAIFGGLHTTLFARLLLTNTTGQLAFLVVEEFFKKKEIPLTNATDGDATSYCNCRDIFQLV
ncbi:hypothetical protein T12_7277 [Trichinella patagoniensis]|uniref:PiggyBac transposable element-derived protein domain-containing protein n=1 Tax=Trichinella patagoniensis TaxID=990121 RepID=A0A0V1A534_9BILA|nr:hypothetical protein T12_7277 [Trichinella patagoniensis]